jgi:hypothetical protein
VLLAELADLDFGYPLDTNEVLAPQPSPPKVPAGLEDLYGVCDGVSMPDVYVGYFLDSAAEAASRPSRGEPTEIQGTTRIPISVFGTDGGGGNRFAIGPGGSIYYLPSSGAVLKGTFHEDHLVKASVKAATLLDFLWLMYGDVKAFINDEKSHVYIPN